MDDLPRIPYHLVNLNDYSAVGFREGNKSIALMATRGCPFRCSFCSIVSLCKRKWRAHSIPRIMEDLAYLESKYGIKDFFFSDDNIAGSQKFFTDLVKALAECGRDYNWGAAGIRADTIVRLDDQTMQNLAKSGCKNLDVGVESGNLRILNLIKKDTTLDIVREANKKLSKYPIIIKFTFMGGFPTETKEEFLDTLKFSRLLQDENEYATAPTFIYTPFPGTELYQLALENGFEPPLTLEGWADFNYNTWYKKHPSWLTKKKISLIENATFLSYFSNKKLAYKYTNPLFKAMFKLYYPLAKFRYDHDFYDLMVEKHLADLMSKANEKFNFFGRFQSKKNKKK